MLMQKQEHSLKFITQVGQELIQLAVQSEGLDNWLARHDHVRLYADDLYGDCDEADILSCAMILKVDDLKKQ